MRPRQGPNAIRLCEAQTFRDPDFPRLQTRPGGKATTAEGRKTQGRRVAAAGAGDRAKSAAAVTDSGFWVLLSLFVVLVAYGVALKCRRPARTDVSKRHGHMLGLCPICTPYTSVY